MWPSQAVSTTRRRGRGRLRRSTIAVGLVVSAMLVPACASPPDRPSNPGRDAPVSFDLAGAVPLTYGQVRRGTLHETAFLWVGDDGVHSMDMVDSGRSWATALPTSVPQNPGSEPTGEEEEWWWIGEGLEFLVPPLVVGDVVVTMIGNDAEAEDGDAMGYTLGLLGVDATTGEVLWAKDLLVLEELSSEDFDCGTRRHAEWSSVQIDESHSAVLVYFWAGCTSTTLLLDPVVGEVLWQDGVTVDFGTVAGRFALAFMAGEAFSVDLQTGQVAAPLGFSAVRSSRHLDPEGRASHTVLKVLEGYESEYRYLVFSSLDGTVEEFWPDEDDFRYEDEESCTQEAGYPVLCGDHTAPMRGVDPESGKVLWEWGPEGTENRSPGYVYVAFRDNIYLTAYVSDEAGSYVIALDTGEIIEPDAVVASIYDPLDDAHYPIMVNEHGAVGRTKNGYAWVPAAD